MSLVDLKSIGEFLNNQSVGAAVGAFAAFLLVALTDWRRERRKVKTLRAEVEANRADAVAKLETARRMRALLREHNKVEPAPVLRFNTALSRQLAAEVRHRLSGDQRRATEGLCYTMEAIDELLNEARSVAQRFTGPMGHAERLSAASYLEVTWADIVTNLKRLIEMSDLYLSRRFKELVNKQYNAADYEEP